MHWSSLAIYQMTIILRALNNIRVSAQGSLRLKSGIVWLGSLLRVSHGWNQGIDSTQFSSGGPGENVASRFILLDRMQFLEVVGLRFSFLAGCQLGVALSPTDLSFSTTCPLRCQANNHALKHSCWIKVALLQPSGENPWLCQTILISCAICV